MKKLISLILCLSVLLCSVSVNTFADEFDFENIKPAIFITNPYMNYSTVEAGSTFDIHFTISSTAYINKTYATVSGGDFTLSGYLASEEVSPYSNNTVTVLAGENMQAGRYPLTLTVTATTFDGVTLTDTCIFNIDVENDSVTIDETTSVPDFSLVEAYIPETKGKANLSTRLHLKFENTTGYEAKNVKVTLSNLGTLVLNSFTDTAEFKKVSGNGSCKASFPVIFPNNPSSQIVVGVTVSYEDSSGGKHSENFNVYLRCKENSAPADSTSLTPKVIVSNYHTDVEKIVSGDEFMLTFVLKNTSVDKAVKNMTVNVIPGTEGGANGAIFSPIDGTTSFYTTEIEKNGELEYTIKLKTSASAGARSYPITISYNFEYENNGMYTQGSGSMDINLPVTQPIKFELMEWYPPTECYGAEGCFINFQYFNKSKNPMSNLAVSVEGDFSMPTQYVGTLGASSYDFFSGQIMPNDPSAIGETKQAILVFTFEDASSNEHRLEYPFEVLICEGFTYEDPGMFEDPNMGGDIGIDMPIIGGEEPIEDPEIAEKKLLGFDLWVWCAIGGGVVAVTVIIIVCCAISRKRKKELLDEDEDF